MKLRIVKIKLFFLLGMGFSFGQTEQEKRAIVSTYDLNVLQEIKIKSEKEFTDNYNKALVYAEQKAWKLNFVDEQGSYHELQGITENGLPIYAKTFNQGSALTARVNKINTGGDLGLNLNGQGMTVGVWDQNHPRISHSDFQGRAMVADASSTAISLHSTHVLGTIISSGSNNMAGRGLAYQADAWVNSWDNDISEMAGQASMGLLVSNHSYARTPFGAGDWYFGSYYTDARSMDNLAFNAPYYQPVVAAGNDRNKGLNVSKGGRDLLVSFGTSKNSVVVAAVNEVPNYTGPNSVVMSGFSSWGPTDDFRIKPDISAKGVAVLSTSNESNTAYEFSQGTSMAAPAVTAVLLLLQQHYNNIIGSPLEPYMRASTLRGLVIHTASEAREVGDSEGPNHKYGWGLIDAEKSVVTLNNKGVTSILDELTLSSGQTYTRNVFATGLEPLVVTIAWTDRPGVISSTIDLQSPRLINDLDLRVFKDGVEYFPWALTKNFSNPVATKTDNNVDNVEKIEIKDADPGVYSIVVGHKGSLTGGVQGFSLIATGVDESLSVNSSSLRNNVKIWPNPVNDILTIKFGDDLIGGKSSVDIYDLRGVRVYSGNTVEGDVLIDVSFLPKGVFLLSISNENGSVLTEKIIKK